MGTTECLICVQDFQVTDTNTDSSQTNVLNSIFKVFCRTFSLSDYFQSVHKFDFLVEPLPFCFSCKQLIAKLWVKQEKIKILTNKVEMLVCKILQIIIESCSHTHTQTNNRNKERLKRDDKKFLYRTEIVKHYDPKVLLSDCKQLQLPEMTIHKTETLFPQNESSFFDDVEFEIKTENDDLTFSCGGSPMSFVNPLEVNDNSPLNVQFDDDYKVFSPTENKTEKESAQQKKTLKGRNKKSPLIDEGEIKEQKAVIKGQRKRRRRRGQRVTMSKKKMTKNRVSKINSSHQTKGEVNGEPNEITDDPNVNKTDTQAIHVDFEHPNLSEENDCSPAPVNEEEMEEYKPKNSRPGKRKKQPIRSQPSTKRKRKQEKVAVTSETNFEGKVSNFHCRRCNLELKTTKQCFAHAKTAHPEYNEKNLSCPFCPNPVLLLPTLAIQESNQNPHNLEETQEPHQNEPSMTERTTTSNPIVVQESHNFKVRTLVQHIRKNHANKMRLMYNVIQASPTRFLYRKFHLFEKMDDRQFKCINCGSTIEGGEEGQPHIHIIKHIKRDHIHPSVGSNIVICHHCGKSFKAQSYLEIHMASHISVRDAVCELCGSSFPSLVRLRSHQKKVHDDGEYKCPHCPKIFSGKYYLNSHLKSGIHSDEVFECPHCQRKLSQIQSLRRHIKELHQDGERTKKFPCTHDQCQKLFFTKNEVSQHLARCHGIFGPRSRRNFSQGINSKKDDPPPLPPPLVDERVSETEGIGSNNHDTINVQLMEQIMSFT